VLHDAKRNQDVHVRVFYPAEPGNYPVIIFSHGAGGSQTCCESLTQHWASYVYITIQPTHVIPPYSAATVEKKTFTSSERCATRCKNRRYGRAGLRIFPCVIDSLTALQSRILGLQGKIDTERIGVAGHSMGSYTAEAIAGARIDLPWPPRNDFCRSACESGSVPLAARPPAVWFNPSTLSTPSRCRTLALPARSTVWVRWPARHGTRIPFDRSVEGDKFTSSSRARINLSFITTRTVSTRTSRGEAILDDTHSAALRSGTLT